MLAHHVERLQSSGYPVIVATTTNLTDDPIIDAAETLDVEVFRGSEDNVLSRFAETARVNTVDVIVRVTSDCPLIDGALVREGVQQFVEANEPSLYLSNTLQRSFPRGFDFEVMSADLLFTADAAAASTHQREHVTPWLYESPQTIIRQLVREDDASDLRVTLDTADDFTLISRLIEQHDAAQLNVDQIISTLRAHPELVALNAHVEQKKLED